MARQDIEWAKTKKLSEEISIKYKIIKNPDFSEARRKLWNLFVIGIKNRTLVEYGKFWRINLNVMLLK